MGAAIVQCNQVLDGGNDVVDGEHGGVQGQLNTELAVDLVTTHLCQVVALGVEVEVVQQQARSFGSNLLTGTQLAVDVLEGFFLGEDGVLLECFLDGGETSKVLRNLEVSK